MILESFVISDVGRKRTKNEDNFLVNNDLQLFAVADGMGGHVGGEMASKLAVKIIEEIILDLSRDPDATLPQDVILRPRDYRGWLKFALGVASQKIFEKAKQDTKLSGMGTTAVVGLFRGNRIFWANVGDSRIYRIRKGRIEQLTEDHSLVGEQIRAGLIKPQEAKEHRLKNIITRSVGFQEDVEVDVEARVVKNSDFYLLCSDGLYNLVDAQELLDVVMNQPSSQVCRQLVDIANARGGDDNITVVLIKVDQVESKDEETLQMD